MKSIMRNGQLLWGVLLCLIFTVCSSSEKETTGKVGEPDTLNKIDHPPGSITKKGANSDRGPVSDIEFTREVTFGSTDKMVVGEIATFAVDDRNRVYVADSDQTTVHVFNPDGTYLTSLGRQGKGPGEFGAVSVNTAMVIHLNQLYVTDATMFFPHRAHVYLLDDLSFSHTMKLLAENKDDFEKLKGYYPNRIYPRNDGTFLVSYHRPPYEYKNAESFIRYVIQDSTVNIISGPIFEQKDRTNLTYNVKNVQYPYLAIHSFPFFGKSLLVVSDDDLLYEAWTEEFKIDVHKSNGEYLHTIRHPFINRSLNQSKLMDRYKKTNYKSELGDGVVLKMLRTAENIPETWPALETMFFDDENRLWISTIVDDFEVYEWWVLKPSGEVITTFEWSREKSIEVVDNGYLYTRETYENGITSIVRYNIENWPL